MAQESPGLMEGLLGLASIQQELAEGKSDKPSVKAIMHYQRALEMHYQSLQAPEALESDIPLAASLLLSHHELWSGELIKLGVHMIGCQGIIGLRGKAAHMTPVGRALFAAFRRLDVSTSLISGNPSFQTDDWWTVDLLTRTPILEDSPPLLSADAAFSKLCVVCSRLPFESLDYTVKKGSASVNTRLHGGGELPQCFKPLGAEEGEDEDINTTEICDITPKLYKHKAIGLVVAYGIGKLHQEWFLSELATRVGETGLHALKFLQEGVRFAYMKLDGMRKGRFMKIKEGAASRIDGVSENLWSAEGMLCSMEALSLYEPDTSPKGKTFTFQGDFDLAEVDLENEVPHESASSRVSTLSPDRTFSPLVEKGRQTNRCPQGLHYVGVGLCEREAIVRR
ncbi:hypothetical protein EV426DRAFT_666238 [Tirmania nivea]|nr:hypothetical protein EV426DRAFT_666238 [Tirmania nivea]